MKNLSLIFLILLISFSGRCSHLMGGEIVVQNDQVGNYEIILTLYRDVSGILLNSNQTLKVFDAGGNQVSTIVSYFRQLYIPSCFWDSKHVFIAK